MSSTRTAERARATVEETASTTDERPGPGLVEGATRPRGPVGVESTRGVSRPIPVGRLVVGFGILLTAVTVAVLALALTSAPPVVSDGSGERAEAARMVRLTPIGDGSSERVEAARFARLAPAVGSDGSSERAEVARMTRLALVGDGSSERAEAARLGRLGSNVISDGSSERAEAARMVRLALGAAGG